MDVWSPLVPNLGPWFNPEGSQSLVQSGYHELLVLLQENGWSGWSLWDGTTATVVSISQNGPH